MKVTTEITRGDLIRFNISIIPRLRSSYISMAVIAVILFIIFVIEIGIPKTLNTWLLTILLALMGGIAGQLGGVIFSSIFILFSSSNNNGILGIHEYEIDDKGLHEKTQANEGLSKWEGIYEIKATRAFILFKISGYLFHIIPKRSFSTESEFNDFYNQSLEFWKNAHNK